MARSVARFDIQEYLAERKSVIDRALHRYLQGCVRHPQTLGKAMHYGLFPGGKRFRPILTLACGELFGGKREALLPFACALEIIHTYKGHCSLHDGTGSVTCSTI